MLDENMQEIETKFQDLAETYPKIYLILDHIRKTCELKH